MTVTLLIVLIVLALMSLVLFLLLKKEVNDINKKSKIYFVHKAQEYTDSINRNDKEDIKDKKIGENKDNNEDNTNNSQVIYVDKKASYEIKDLFKMMRIIDNNFSYSNTRLINYFIKNYVIEDEDKLSRYTSLKKMKNYIYKIGIYNIIVNDDVKVIDAIVKELRLFNEDLFMEFYSGKESFDVEDFCNFLDYEIGKCDPTIYIYVGNNKLNYDRINKRIKTIYSKDIYKGIKIVYLNKLYDYSLSL